MSSTVHLGPRLFACAACCRKGARVADIGTDHAHLPVYLIQSGTAPSAVASDINTEPLRSAAANVERCGLGGSIRLALGSGLDTVAPGEVDDIVIAGMGGDLIAAILDAAPWVRDERYHLILQPMSKPERLRAWLFACGFEIMRETAVIDSGRCYSVMLCVYTGVVTAATRVQLYCGRVTELSGEAAARYLRTAAGRLENELSGARIRGDAEEAAALESDIKYIMENIDE